MALRTTLPMRDREHFGLWSLMSPISSVMPFSGLRGRGCFGTIRANRGSSGVSRSGMVSAFEGENLFDEFNHVLEFAVGFLQVGGLIGRAALLDPPSAICILAMGLQSSCATSAVMRFARACSRRAARHGVHGGGELAKLIAALFFDALVNLPCAMRPAAWLSVPMKPVMPAHEGHQSSAGTSARRQVRARNQRSKEAATADGVGNHDQREHRAALRHEVEYAHRPSGVRGSRRRHESGFRRCIGWTFRTGPGERRANFHRVDGGQ